jgi:hypothetical protein
MKDTFPQRVSIRSVAALQRATALILHYRRQLKTAEEKLEADILALREKHAKNFQCRVGKKHTLPIEDRIGQLETAVAKYTDKERETVFGKGRKTQALGPATVQLRDEAGRIDFLPGCNRRTAAAGIVAKTKGFQTAFSKLLKQFGLAGWIVAQWDLDWSGIKAGRKQGEITDEELEEAGMYWEEPTRVRIGGTKR